MAYARRHVGGFVDKPTLTTPIDSTFLNAVEAALLKLYALDPADAQIMSWVAANSRFEPTLIKNANIDPAAAIAKSKLAALSITDADVAGGAAIAQSKLALALVQPTNFAPGSKITTSPLAGGPPASPSDGDIWIATGVDANGTRWQFQYNAGSASPYKWEFIGGPAALVANGGGVTYSGSSGVWTALSGQAFTCVRGGVYDLRVGALLTPLAFTSIYTAYTKINCSNPAGLIGYPACKTFIGASDAASVVAPALASGAAPGATLTQMAMIDGAATNTAFNFPWFDVTPVRIS